MRRLYNAVQLPPARARICLKTSWLSRLFTYLTRGAVVSTVALPIARETGRRAPKRTAGSLFFADLSRFLSNRFFRSMNHKNRYRANFRFLSSRFFHFSDEKNPTERNRLAIWSTFLEKPTGWRYRFFLSKLPSLVNTRCLMQEPQPYRIDARGRAQAEVGLLRPWAGRARSFALRLVVWWVIAQQSQSCDLAAS